ncbi:MAG TPA: hypothetical protein PLB73_15725, partial [Leptospiraceae bacterium]|nr:hypothetical protein [Leptospiraceae bacterium]
MARLLICTLLLISSSVLADTILLKNGQKIEGLIVYQDADVVHLQTADKTIVLQKNLVKRISYSPLQKPDAKKQDNEAEIAKEEK